MNGFENREHHRSNIGLFLILGAGILLLLGAGAVLLTRGQSAPPEPEQQLIVPEPISNIPAPLVAPKEEAPLASLGKETSDTGQQQIEVKKPVVMGTIDPKAVATFIDERFVLLKSCYERRLRNNPMLEGKIDVNIGIAPNGTVTSVKKSTDSVRDQEMWGCIKQTIRKWRFPKPKGGPVEVAKVFNFKKSN